ncbi:ATP-binding protein [Ideonella sp. DXS22W]|uniref:ATP-binding protein n=1 Tax=Pseudaquabacterium inlustre TaxID=2984192 RepID=A0ABU9CFZ3_9BURK
MLLVLLWLCVAGLGAAQAEVLVLRQALAAPGAGVQPPDWSAAKTVVLPDDWAEHPTGALGERWYRLGFDGAQLRQLMPDQAPGGGALHALYVERACSVLQVRVNGHLVHDGGRFSEPVSRHCHHPQLVAVPDALLLPGQNSVELRVKGYDLPLVSSRQRVGGLSVVEFGSHAVLAGHHARRALFAVRLPEVMSGTLLLMGGLMFVMGWFNRAQSYLAYFGALMVGWAVLLARLWASDLPFSNRLAELGLAALMGFITWASVQFLLRYVNRRLGWVNVALPLQLLLMCGTLLIAGPQNLHWVSGLWFVLLAMQVLAAAIYYLARAQQHRSRQLWPMAGLLVVVGVAVLVQATTILAQLDSRIGYVAELVPPLAFIAMGLRLVQQFGRAFQSSEQSRAELEVRIREATAQIERNFSQLAELKVEQVTDRERKRIAADLHDDLGAKLLTIVHTSESDRIATLAREALEEMRLSVRGLTGKPVRLSDAFGDWRAEVMSRLTQSGIQGEWSAPHDDETPQTLSSRAYVQTTRILREAVSNIIKHSGASQCSVRCSIADGDFQLIIQDNGQGIPVELDGRLDKGHGMASMKGRAKQLQGQCLVESSPGYGTVIRLTLPLDRHLTSA